MEELIIQCPKCGKPFNCISKKNYRKKFCSRQCANSRTWNESKRKKHAIIAKKHPRYKPAKFEIRICLCKKEFIVKPFLKKKFCCYRCSVVYRSKEIKTGGYREGSGRSKSGYYHGIYCGSTYELCWVIYCVDKKIKFERFRGFIEKDGIKYYPDFILNKKNIVEIKGYWTDAVDKKTKIAESFGYRVKVLYKEYLKEIFSYVEEKYKTKKFYTLYDNHKPNYKKTCNYCLHDFHSEKKSKTKNVFCSRVCSGKFRKVQNTPCR